MQKTIYKITNSKTDELLYIGSTTNLKKRAAEHVSRIKASGYGKQVHMYTHLNKIGLSNLVITPFDKGTTHTELFHINTMKPKFNKIKTLGDLVDMGMRKLERMSND